LNPILDYKSAAFDILRSHLRDAQALTCLFILLDSASLIALVLGMLLCGWVNGMDRLALSTGLKFSATGVTGTPTGCAIRATVDWRHYHAANPPAACASQRKRDLLDCGIEFSCYLILILSLN